MRLPRHRAIFAITVVFAVACLWIVESAPQGVHWSPDSATKFLAIKSLRYESGIRYDVPYLGKKFDPEMRVVPVGETYYDIRDGEVHISWPELFPVIVYPFYRLFGWFGLFVVPIFCGAASIYLTGRITELIRPGTGWIAALLTAVASPVIIYSTLLWEHTPALALMLSAVFLSVQFLKDHTWWKVAVGAGAVGLAAAGLRTDANIFFASWAGALFLVVRGRRRWWVPPVATLGFVIGAAPASALNWITNGKILAANTMKNAPPPSLAYLKKVGIGIIPHFFAGKTVPLLDAWLVILATVTLVTSYYFLKGRVRAVFMVLAMGAVTIGSMLSLYDARSAHIDRFHGFLAMSPVLALGLLFSPKRARDARADGARLVLATLVLLCSSNLIALTVSYPEGWASDFNREWGPRYWLVVFPLLGILTGVNYDAILGRARGLVANTGVVLAATSLLVASIVFEIAGLDVIADSGVDLTQVRATLEQQGDAPLVSDFCLTSSLSPEQFFRRPSFYIPHEDRGRFAAWFQEAAERGLTRFDLAAFSKVTVTPPFVNEPVGRWKFVIDGVSRDRDLRIAHVRAVRSP